MSFARLLPFDMIADLDLKASFLPLWLRHFDIDFYRSYGRLRGDVVFAELSDKALVNHFVTQGWREKRPYSRYLHSFLEPAFYRKEYPDLGLDSDDAAVKHWMYEGYFEDRIPNEVTKKLIDASIHLFQMGKVGSKSIEAAIIQAGYPNLVPHLHWPIDMITTYPDCILSYGELVRRPRSDTIRFVSGLRDPFERLISGYYQSTNSPFSSHTRAAGGLTADAAFLEWALRAAPLIVDWFEHRYYRQIDVYSVAFDPERGCSIVNGEGASAFIYRVDRLKNCWMPLSDFLGLPLRPTHANVSAAKDYAAAYSQAINSIKFPEDFVNAIVASTYCRHFFADDERAAMAIRWSQA